ncbi:MAG: hypothetical protein JNN27_13145 [Planctomycetes bacterium]|nr:hypothetical protein [Planctomycetota bacterium]
MSHGDARNRRRTPEHAAHKPPRGISDVPSANAAREDHKLAPADLRDRRGPRPYASPFDLIGPRHLACATSLASRLRSEFQHVLQPADVVGIVMIALLPSFRRARMERGRPLSGDMDVEAARLSLLAALMASGPSGYEAGIFSRVALPYDVVLQRIDEFLATWLESLTAHRIHLETKPSEPLHPRGRAIVMLCDYFDARGMQDGEVLLGDIRAGLELALGRPLRGDERDPAELAGCLRELAGTPDGLFDMAFLDNSGRVRLGQRQVKDRAKTRARRERFESKRIAHFAAPTDARHGEANAQTLDAIASTEATPPEALEAREREQLLQAVRECVESEGQQLRQSKRRGERVLGTHIWELLSGSISVESLCRPARLKRTQLYERLRSIRERITSAMSMI